MSLKCFFLFKHFQANDSYLQMAIGNAPWPIGVTMVGIHARTGREKIFSQNVARILFLQYDHLVLTCVHPVVALFVYIAKHT